MKILMATSEAVPFVKTGGLADVVTSLSKALSKSGHDVRMCMPRYYNINRNNLKLLCKGMEVDMVSYKTYADVYESEAISGVKAYFIDYEELFGRDGVYGHGGKGEYSDNPLRFAFFARAVFSLCVSLKWMPDIMHSHDWAAALLPVLLKHGMQHVVNKRIGNIFSIHNMGYQGSFPLYLSFMLGMSEEFAVSSGMEFYGRLNFLKGGIEAADIITSVSPTYAREIQTAEGGFGLDFLLRRRSCDLVGILNGVDEIEWNPAKDKRLPFNYSVNDMSGKAKCKAALRERFALKGEAERPIVGMISRFAKQKGIDEVFAPTYGSLYRMCTECDLDFVLLGSGEEWCEREVRALQAKLPNFKAHVGYSENLAHLIEAGSDLFLMPSHYEPCGLNQLYSLLYGTLPIVRRVGGLADTVVDEGEREGEGTGFVFDYISPDAVFQAVKRAVGVYKNDKKLFHAMQKRAMKCDFTWSRSAKEYEKVYKRALS